jgi:CO/xanthine dehydrogenase Mo-binding subunit
MEKVRFIGDEVAGVAAVDEDTAEEALDLIKVEYEPLKAVFDPVEAMQESAPRIHEQLESNVFRRVPLECGDTQKGFEEADYILEDSFRTQAQAHCCLETQCCIASFVISGRLSLWSNTQSPHDLKEKLAVTCNLPMNKVRVIKPYVGGGFGRSSRMESHEPVSVFLAKVTGMPVKIQITREEEFLTSRTRHPFIMKLKMGVKKNGTLTAKEASVILDNGAYNSWGPIVLVYSCAWFSALYRVPNVKFGGSLVYTNKNYGGACRGFGDVQMTFAQESLLDQVAEKLRMDLKEIKLINANQPGDITANRIKISSCGLKECIELSAKEIQWEEKRKKMGKDTHQGVGMASMIYTAGGSMATGKNAAAASIRLEVDGSFTLSMGASDIGQGSNTVLSQIAAEELGVSIDQISLVETDTSLTPIDLGTYGSRITLVAGNAVQEAAKKVKEKILEIASEKLEANIDDLILNDGQVSIKGQVRPLIDLGKIAAISYYEKNSPILGAGYYNGPKATDDFDPVSWRALPAPGVAFANQIAEVKVDPETGSVDVLRFVAAHDIGKAINPMACEGQVEGGAAMGIGLALSEELMFEDGKIRNPSFADYKYLTSMDVPPITSIFVESNEPNGPFGAKGIGEGVLIPTAPAVANAIYHATGIRFNELPITPEKILRALKDKKEG